MRLNAIKNNKKDGLISGNNIVYGVSLKKMRKVLVVRTPYVFYNRTKLTYEVKITNSF